MPMNPLRIDDFKTYHFLSDIQFAPDGCHAAFVASKAKEDLGGYDAYLYVINTETDTCRQLTTGGDDKTFTWLDSSRIIFPSRRNKKDHKETLSELTTYYTIDIFGGEAKECFTVPFTASSLRPIGDDKFFFIANIDLNPVIPFTNCEPCSTPYAKENIEIIDELPYMYSGQRFISKKRRQLF